VHVAYSLSDWTHPERDPVRSEDGGGNGLSQTVQVTGLSDDVTRQVLCLYLCMHICVCIYVCTFAFVFMYAHLCASKVHLNTSIYIYVCVCVCVHVCVCV